ncbi:MAG: hypothetical protein ACUVSY_18535 [Roseiflexus sp.]
MATRQMKDVVAWMVIVLILLGVPACAGVPGGHDEILIGLTEDAARFIRQPQQPDPLNTGLPSLDALNRKWRVQRMIPVFPDVSPTDAAAVRHGLAGVYKLVVAKGTNLRVMIQEYRLDPNIAYAEINTPVETK